MKITENDFFSAIGINREEVKKIAQLTSKLIIVYWLDGHNQRFKINKSIIIKKTLEKESVFLGLNKKD